jgi:multidrug efflux pump subunit AcrA (membrane-fusion protein)
VGAGQSHARRYRLQSSARRVVKAAVHPGSPEGCYDGLKPYWEEFGVRLKDIRLLPGMPAEVFIQTHDRTPLQYLLKPLQEQIARTFRER